MLVVGTTVALAFVPQSFRMQSTASIWEDDYDLIFDPGRTTEIAGHRVYTSLSNYVTGNEQQFGLGSSNFFLVGGSTRFGARAFPAGILDHHSFNTPLFTGLYDPYSGDSLFGSGKLTDVEWQDPDSNGTYDFKRVAHTEQNAWRSGCGTDFYLACGILAGKNRFGVGLAFNDTCRTGVLPGLDYVRHDYDSSLVAGRIVFLSDDTSRYASRTQFDSKRLVLSGRFELAGGSVLGVNVQPALVGADDGHGRTAWSYADRNPGGSGAKDYSLLTLKDSVRFPTQGMDIPVNLQWVTTQTGSYETRLNLSGFFGWQNLAPTAGGDSVAYYEQTLNPGLASTLDSVSHRFRGATGNKGLSASLLDLHWLGERFDLGWGLRFGIGTWTDSLVDTFSMKQVTRYDNGDSIQNASDYVRTVTSAESWLRRSVSLRKALALPVGLEYRVIPSIALRLGAIHTLSWNDAITTSQLLSLAPRKTRTDFGDGTFSETWDTPQRNPTSSEARQSFSQSTTFTYGAGFRPIEQLQLDLMGFANLTNLSNWRLSATFRF
jgi:hypothetical protein